MLLAWHESRHSGLITDHSTGHRLTAQQIVLRFGHNHPAIIDGSLADLAALTRFAGELREEIAEERSK